MLKGRGVGRPSSLYTLSSDSAPETGHSAKGAPAVNRASIRLRGARVHAGEHLDALCLGAARVTSQVDSRRRRAPGRCVARRPARRRASRRAPRRGPRRGVRGRRRRAARARRRGRCARCRARAWSCVLRRRRARLRRARDAWAAAGGGFGRARDRGRLGTRRSAASTRGPVRSRSRSLRARALVARMRIDAMIPTAARSRSSAEQHADPQAGGFISTSLAPHGVAVSSPSRHGKLL